VLRVKAAAALAVRAIGSFGDYQDVPAIRAFPELCGVLLRESLDPLWVKSLGSVLIEDFLYG
jgi:hypothetical protein